MLRDSSAPTASGVDSHEPDLPRPDTDFPDPGCLHASSHSPSAMDISLHVFPALTLKHAPFGMHDICPASATTTTTKDATSSLSSLITNLAPPPNEPFGPWMKFERRQRRIVRKGSSSKSGGSNLVVQGSHFNPLFEENTLVKITPLNILPKPVVASAKSISLIMEPQDNISVERNNNGKSQAKFPSAKQRKSHAKSPLTKQRSPTTVRKPLSVQLPTATPSSKPTLLPTRLNSSLSSDRFAPFPHQSHRSNKSRHTAVVVVENDDPTAPGCDSLPVPAHNSHVDTIVSSLFGVVMPPSLDDTSIVCQVLTNVAVFTLDECLTETQSQDQ
ncbi:hypothetical protein V6N13_052930 [Hibiscus sabdariffa]